MKTATDFLHEAKEALENIEVEYEGDPILLNSAVEEALEAINRAIGITKGEY